MNTTLTPDLTHYAGIKATRKEWVMTTWADSLGVWHCQITNPLGWGNTGARNIDRHISALRGRARRAIAREIQARQALPMGKLRLEVADTQQHSTGVTRSITFKER